jgi:predicted nucleic acid-binding protein
VPHAAVILDTNVFVAAGFNRRSASARIVEQVRSGQLRMIWNEETRRETQYILSKIPPVSWSKVAALFRDEDRYDGATSPEEFDYIPDADDRKFAALSEATGVALITNDDHLLSNRDRAGLEILTPREYWDRQET